MRPWSVTNWRNRLTFLKSKASTVKSIFGLGRGGRYSVAHAHVWTAPARLPRLSAAALSLCRLRWAYSRTRPIFQRRTGRLALPQLPPSRPQCETNFGRVCEGAALSANEALGYGEDIAIETAVTRRARNHHALLPHPHLGTKPQISRFSEPIAWRSSVIHIWSIVEFAMCLVFRIA